MREGLTVAALKEPWVWQVEAVEVARSGKSYVLTTGTRVRQVAGIYRPDRRQGSGAAA
jgi:hypothetical protein